MNLKEQVCHDHRIDLFKLEREWDIRRGIELEEDAGFAFGPFHREFVLRSAPEKVRQILEEMRRGSEIGLLASRQGFVSMDAGDAPSANLRAAIASTTNETNLWDPGVLGLLPAGVIIGGRAWRVGFGGIMGTTGTPTQTWTTRIGTNNAAPPTGTTLGAGPTFTLGTITAQPFFGQGIYNCRSIGVAASTATMTGNGFVICPGAAAATTVATPVFGGTVATTIDQTVNQGIGVSMTWSASSASNTLTPQCLAIETLN